MIVTVTETIAQIEMNGLSAKIGPVEMIDQHAKIGRVVKTEVAVKSVAGVMIVKIAETKVDGKTVLVTMIVEAVITVVATNTEITTGIALNARIPTSPSAQNVIAVVSLKAREEAVDAMTEEVGKTVHVATIVEAVIIVVTNTVITTGIALNARTPTLPFAQNVIVVGSPKAKEEAEVAAIIAEIIPVAVKAGAVKAGAVIVEINTATMIGIAPSVKTLISVSVLNAIAVVNPRAKAARIATAMVKMIAEEERVAHAVMLGL
jgi:hypothetical protein